MLTHDRSIHVYISFVSVIIYSNENCMSHSTLCMSSRLLYSESKLKLCMCAQDVSRLVDVCRQSIVIERPEDLAGCLHSIAEDPHVEVLLVEFFVTSLIVINSNSGPVSKRGCNQ